MKLFISKLHYKNKDKTDFFETLLLKVLLFFSFFYGKIVQIRNYLYDKNVLKIFKPSVFTISIGNITTGGVGKTPVTAEIANYFSAKGKNPAILSRGYGGELKNSKPNLISDGKKIFFDSEMAGDEPVWLCENCCNTAVITCSKRTEAAKKAVDDLLCDVLIMDDGFQHRKLERDLNLLLIDNKNRFGNEYLLPAGPLREPPEQINRADKIILVNKSFDDESALKYCIELENKFSKKVYLCKLLPENAYNLITNEQLEKNTSVIAFSAIGQPQEFYEFLKKDYHVCVTVDFPDHYMYDELSLKELIEIANKENIKHFVTTEKDAVKIKKLIDKYSPEFNFYALKLKAYLDVEEICNG